MKTKDIITLIIGIIIIGILLPTTIEIKYLIFKNNELVKIIWTDGSISELKNNKWIHHKKDD